jgi:hypothetical protein
VSASGTLWIMFAIVLAFVVLVCVASQALVGT